MQFKLLETTQNNFHCLLLWFFPVKKISVHTNFSILKSFSENFFLLANAYLMLLEIRQWNKQEQ